MNLEDYVAKLNSLSFFREFTFSQTKFQPQLGAEVELADNLVWLGNRGIVIQLKQRSVDSGNSAAERNWFTNKVVGKATSQIRDSIQFLNDHSTLQFSNERGHIFDVQCRELIHITKIIVYLAGSELPHDCRQKKFHVSKTAGFIHILEAHDYLAILEKLRLPDDIISYFTYRERVLPRVGERGAVLDEPDIMGAFINDEDIPNINSALSLHRFVQDYDSFDISWLLANLHDHINKSTHPYDYYKILLEFSKIPRSMWRAIKLRLDKSVNIVKNESFELPYKVTYPKTSCTFMIAPFHPDIPAVGPDGEQARLTWLQSLTQIAMYIDKAGKGLGIMISKDGPYLHIDWCLVEMKWKEDTDMEEFLKHNCPFRESSVKTEFSFFLLDDGR